MTALTKSLEPLLSAAVADQSWPSDRFGFPDWGSETLASLRAALDASPELAFLDDSLQVVGTQAGPFSRDVLGWWLLKRAVRMSTTTALAELLKCELRNVIDTLLVEIGSQMRTQMLLLAFQVLSLNFFQSLIHHDENVSARLVL